MNEAFSPFIEIYDTSGFRELREEQSAAYAVLTSSPLSFEDIYIGPEGPDDTGFIISHRDILGSLGTWEHRSLEYC